MVAGTPGGLSLDARFGRRSHTRLWLGVRPATALKITDDLDGPLESLEQLDWTFRLPAPETGWDF